MRRIAAPPRANWQSKVEAAGLTWHTPGQPYWNESAFYAFTAREVDILEAAANELEEMSLAAVQHVIDNQLYTPMGIPANAIPLVETSWEAEPPSLYGRFDLAYCGDGSPKLLEYNADTPTSLLEAAVAQWYWLEDAHPGRGQFNSIHERLIALWKEMAPLLPGGRIDFCSMTDLEDQMTVAYLLDTAQQAGLAGSMFLIDEIGWDGARFVAPDDAEHDREHDTPLRSVFKLYPWEWMVREEFGAHLGAGGVNWIEPAWKMLLSNKGLLPVLWKLYPHHPNLLEASWDAPDAGRAWVRKPLLGREGANVTLHQPGRDFETTGEYGAEGFVYQDLAPLKSFDGKYPVIGSWVIGHREGDAAAGIGIRESDIPITTNLSQFVPHLFD
jgi:glutathionylspermidine synthase